MIQGRSPGSYEIIFTGPTDGREKNAITGQKSLTFRIDFINRASES